MRFPIACDLCGGPTRGGAGQTATAHPTPRRRHLRLAAAWLAATALGAAPLTDTLAADWEYVAATGASNVYVDLASVKTREQTRTAWYLFDHLDTRYDIDSARVFKSSMHLIEVDCGAQTLTWTRLEKFAGPLGTGTKVSARNVDSLAASFLETVPDPAREAMAIALCTD